jgi:hypothetical protein
MLEMFNDNDGPVTFYKPSSKRKRSGLHPGFPNCRFEQKLYFIIPAVWETRLNYTEA